jgi:hypothetical protein
MSKLILSIIVGALIMLVVDKWKYGDLSAGQMMAAVQDTSQMLVSMQR